VLTADARLAPEDPFPAAVDDCWESFLWAVNGSASELSHVNTNVIAVGGSSAGGNLTAIVCQRATRIDLGGKKVVLQLLSVPVMDNTALATNNPSWKENEFTPALPAAKMLWYRCHYLPNQADWPHPEASPLFWDGDWSRLPPAVTLVGELDVLRHEGQQFGNKLLAAGVESETHVMKGQPHPFIAMDGVLEAGRSAITIFCEALLRATAR
jgi:acetyl esterase/lipase